MAPTAGFVLIIGTSRAVGDTPGTCPCEFAIRPTDGTTAKTASQGVIQDVASINDTASLTVNTVYAVAAGTNTFTIQGQRTSGTAEVLNFTTISLLFVPFGNSGGSVLDVDGPTQSQDGKP